MVIYFTGTGNSQYVAEMIAQQTGDKLVSANACIKSGKKAELESEKPWVFVFPIYLSKMVQVLEKLILEGDFKGSKQAYFVATCAGSMGCTPNCAIRLCAAKGWTFMGAQKIDMPQNYVLMGFTMYEPEECIRRVTAARVSAAEIAEKILAGQSLDLKKVSVAEEKVTLWVETLYNKYVKASTKKFYTTEACVGCGLCEKVCPLNNIKMENGKPVWGRECIHCTACFHRCPKQAIEFGKKTPGKPRYLCDMYKNS